MNAQTIINGLGRACPSRAKSSAVKVLLTVATCLASAGVLSSGRVACAQNTNATIRGQVLDPTGAQIPGAHVLIVNQNTGVTVFDGTSDSAGAFVAPQVIPGTYRIKVDAPGLKESVIDNFIATVAQVASVTSTCSSVRRVRRSP